MLQLSQGTRPEQVFAHFIEVYRREQHIFQPPTIIVPTMTLANDLRGRLATALTVSWNMEMQFWAMFEWRLIESAARTGGDAAYAPLGPVALHWKIFAHLQEREGEILRDRAHPLNYFVQRLVRGDGQNSRRFWNFAGEMARIFSTYLNSRPDWLELWQRGQPPLNDFIKFKETKTPKWLYRHYQRLYRSQHYLFNQLFAHDFAVRERRRRYFYQHLARFQDKLPRCLLVYLLKDATRHQLEALKQLGQFTNVYLFHQSPTLHYLNDLVDGHWSWKKSLEPGWEDQHFDQGHYLLSRLGKNYRSLGQMLLAADLEADITLEVEPAEPTRLLAALQQDLEELNSEAEGRPEWLSQLDLQEDDDSLRIFGCQGLQRQLEVLRGQLVRWLGADKNRRLSDILIVLPRIGDEQRALIQAVFPASGDYDGHRLPARITGVASSAAENLWHSLTGFYSLLAERFDLHSLADWLLLPDTHRALELDQHQVQRLLSLLKQASFRRGFDEAHLRESLGPDDGDLRFNFCASLDRLVDALLLAEDRQLQIGLNEAPLVDKLCQLTLIFRRSRELIRAQAPLATHLEHIQGLLQEFYGFAADSEGHSALRKILRDLHYSLHGARPLLREEEQKKLNLGFIWDFVGQRLAEKQTGGEPSGVITISTLGNMQLVPFKLIACLNLNQDDFPRQRPDDRYNLRQLDRSRPGDRESEEDDRAAFLDLFASARESLWFFYDHIDPDDGEQRLPAKPLEELLFHLQRRLHKHSYLQLAPANPFDGPDPVPLWHQLQRRLAQEGQSRQKLNLEPVRLAPLTPQTVYLRQLIRDLNQPLAYYLRQHQLPPLHSAPVWPRRETLYADGLERHALKEFYLQHPEETNPLLPAGAAAQAWQYDWDHGQRRRRDQFLQEHGAIALTAVSEKILQLPSGITLRANLPASGTGTWLAMSASRRRPKYVFRQWLHHLAFNFQGGQCSICAYDDGTLALGPVADAAALLRPYLQFHQRLGAALVFLPFELFFAENWQTAIRDLFNERNHYEDLRNYDYWLREQHEQVEAQLRALLQEWYEYFHGPFRAAQLALE